MSRHTWQQNVTAIMWPFQQQGTLMQPDNAFSSISWKSRMSRHTSQQNVTTIMWTFRCDLQPQIPKHPILTYAQTHLKQLEATVTVRQKKRQTDRSRTRRTHEVPFIADRSHFTWKNTRFRAPASSPAQAPCNVHAAITMHFAARRG